MPKSKEAVDETIASTKLHNQNCFNYLRNLKIAAELLSQFPPELSDLSSIIKHSKTDYNPQYPYADLYTNFFKYIDANIDDIAKSIDTKQQELDLLIATIAQWESTESQNEDQIKKIRTPLQSVHKNNKEKLKGLEKEVVPLTKAFNEFVVSIYANDNHILENTFNKIKHIPQYYSPTAQRIEKAISQHTKDTGESVNTQSQSPAQAGSMYGRFTAMMSDEFKSQHQTSLSTIRHYRHNADKSPIEYRFGTQGQRHGGKERVSPTFEQFLSVERGKATTEHPITHIYFNNLGRDRDDMEGKKEKALTHVLEALEARHPNAVVITFPADKGLMSHGDFKSTKPEHSYNSVRSQFLAIASQGDSSKDTPGVRDFYISQSTRNLLFQDKRGNFSPDTEKEILNTLLDKSFMTMGVSEDKPLSGAQRQAVWFHFIKYELTNYIIKKLQPDSINFSCKDAIDRGGVSSAYYNLIKSFETDKPMSREDFDQGLHAAPAMVKGRGMNHHIHLIWNTVDAYINTNYQKLSDNPDQSWLIEWRDFNCPHDRVDDLLKRRVVQLQQELTAAANLPVHAGKKEIIGKGLEILAQIEKQTQQDVSGKRMLLEAAIRTPQLALNPTQKNEESYSKLADNLTISFPALKIIGGLMKAFVGLVINSESIYKSGMATFRSGVEAVTRTDLQAKMKEQLKAIKHSNEPSDDLKFQNNTSLKSPSN